LILLYKHIYLFIYLFFNIVYLFKNILIIVLSELSESNIGKILLFNTAKLVTLTQGNNNNNDNNNDNNNIYI